MGAEHELGTVILSALSIASTSIGIHYYNKYSDCKKTKTGNNNPRNFLWVILVLSILALLVSGGILLARIA